MNSNTMKIKRKIRGVSSVRRLVLTPLILCAAILIDNSKISAEEVDGFTEPYRTVNVAGVEVGVIMDVLVREGQEVTKGEPLAKLDHDLQDALLAIAKKNMELLGQLNSAKAELKLRRHRLKKLEKLAEGKHARKEEVERARADVAISEAHVLSAEEELLVRQLEYKKIKVQLSRRTITAPIGGVIVQIFKREGELVAPNDPYVVKMVELDKLTAMFSVPSEQAQRLRVEQKVVVRMVDVTEPVKGEIEYVSPVTDAESGTVRIKVRIENAEGAYRSGERCSLLIPTLGRNASK